jgi:hypothetical protein
MTINSGIIALGKLAVSRLNATIYHWLELEYHNSNKRQLPVISFLELNTVWYLSLPLNTTPVSTPNPLHIKFHFCSPFGR